MWHRRRNLLSRWLPAAILVVSVLFVVSCGGAPAQRGWSGGTLQGNTLYVGSRDGRLIAIDVSEGSRTWASDPLKTLGSTSLFGCSQPALSVAIYGIPAISDNEVYVGGYDGKVYSFVPGEAKPDRDFPNEGRIGSIIGSLVAQSGSVYFGSDDKKVYSLTSRLQQQWVFETEGKIWSTPAVESGTLYIGSFDRNLYALDAATGEKKWAFPTQGVITATPIVADGMVYVGSFDQSLYAIDAASGQLRWRFEAEHGFWATPIIVNGLIYAPALDGKVYVLSTDGEKAAEVDLKAAISSSPVVVDGDVVVSTQESRGTATEKSGAVVWAIDTGTHEARELVRLAGEKVYAPLAAGAGSVYVHTDKDSLYGIDVGSGALRQFAIK